MKRNKKLAAGLAVLSIALIAGLVVLVLVAGGGKGTTGSSAKGAPGGTLGANANADESHNGLSPAGRASSETSSEETTARTSPSPTSGSEGTAPTGDSTVTVPAATAMDASPHRARVLLLDMSGDLSTSLLDVSDPFTNSTTYQTLTIHYEATDPVYEMGIRFLVATGGYDNVVNWRDDPREGTKTISLRLSTAFSHRLEVIGRNVAYRITISEI